MNKPEKEPIRLLISDDHALFRDGLRALISTTEDIELVGEASSGEEAVSKADLLQPDVVLMDINMPGINGVQATREILRANPTTGIIMVTMLKDDASVFSAMRAGARGYVLKGAKYTELLQTIRAVANGQALFGPAIASRIMSFFDTKGSTIKSALPEDMFPELTPRELEVLELIAQGASNNLIAGKLVIADKTVRNHINSIFSKLQVADRAAAIIQARDAGFGASE
jgi:DNA-binding NarL/FixJ family response regulator